MSGNLASSIPALSVRPYIEEMGHEAIRDLVGFLVRQFPVRAIKDWHGDVALPSVREVRVTLHGAT